jgi:hypothetical protein
MAQQARVTSIAELEAFRASLVRFIEYARRALDDATGEARRTGGWLDGECTLHWEREFKRAERALEQAEQELYSAGLSSIKTSDSFRKMAVLKARRRLAKAAEKRKLVKRWRQVYDRETAPLLRHIESLHDKLARDLPAGVVSLGESIRALEAYAETRRPVRSGSEASSGAGETEPGDAPGQAAQDGEGGES